MTPATVVLFFLSQGAVSEHVAEQHLWEAARCVARTRGSPRGATATNDEKQSGEEPGRDGGSLTAGELHAKGKECPDGHQLGGGARQRDK